MDSHSIWTSKIQKRKFNGKVKQIVVLGQVRFYGCKNRSSGEMK